MMNRLIGPAAALLALAHPMAAAAHIVLAEPEARAGSYHAGFFRVSHGCGASDTLSIRIEIPKSILIARPQAKPGWSVSMERAALSEPLPGEGGAITERVSAITWSGRLPADQFDTFGVMMKLPEAAGPLHFPTTQSCVEGTRAWVEIPGPGEAPGARESPAPVLILRPAEGHEGHQ
ncbi:MAG: YcnI family protein [Alphaproteobacteria bacterium]|nr:YcnI family protein [Alphaproteobacteria bacterium]